MSVEEAAKALSALADLTQLREKPAVENGRVAAAAVEGGDGDHARGSGVVFEQPLDDYAWARLVDVQDDDRAGVVGERAGAEAEGGGSAALVELVDDDFALSLLGEGADLIGLIAEHHDDALQWGLAELTDLVLDQRRVAPFEEGLRLSHPARFAAGQQYRGDGHAASLRLNRRDFRASSRARRCRRASPYAS